MVYPAHQLIIDLLYSAFPPSKKLALIDYGCGNGLLFHYLSKDRIKEYRGVDINKFGIDKASREYSSLKNAHFQRINKKPDQFFQTQDKVDAVVLVGVFQYMPERDVLHFVNLTKKILKKNGVLIFSSPTDHKMYQLVNIYGHFVPHRFLNRQKMVSVLEKEGFSVDFQTEKGFLIMPFFSQVILCFIDALDKIIFHKKGTLGIIGKTVRYIFNPVFALEYRLPVNFGYTFFIKASIK